MRSCWLCLRRLLQAQEQEAEVELLDVQAGKLRDLLRLLSGRVQLCERRRRF